MGPKFLLVVQVAGETAEDFDALIELEHALLQKLPEHLKGDGHDFGSGEGDLFFRTDDPRAAFEAYRKLAGTAALEGQRIAFREVEGEVYEVLRPPGLDDFRIL